MVDTIKWFHLSQDFCKHPQLRSNDNGAERHGRSRSDRPKGPAGWLDQNHCLQAGTPYPFSARRHFSKPHNLPVSAKIFGNQSKPGYSKTELPRGVAATDSPQLRHHHGLVNGIGFFEFLVSPITHDSAVFEN